MIVATGSLAEQLRLLTAAAGNFRQRPGQEYAENASFDTAAVNDLPIRFADHQGEIGQRKKVDPVTDGVVGSIEPRQFQYILAVPVRSSVTEDVPSPERAGSEVVDRRGEAAQAAPPGGRGFDPSLPILRRRCIPLRHIGTLRIHFLPNCRELSFDTERFRSLQPEERRKKPVEMRVDAVTDVGAAVPVRSSVTEDVSGHLDTACGNHGHFFSHHRTDLALLLDSAPLTAAVDDLPIRLIYLTAHITV